jgi:cyclophilin family peptidyl-prolyl cis-trans isomerase
MNKSFQGEIYMSPKKKVNKAQAQKTEKTIQYVAIAMVVIVVGLIAWPYIAKLLPQKADAVTSASVGDVGSGTACAAFDSIAAAKQYSEAPPMKVDQAKQYFATFKMAKGGEFIVELYPAKAPITVNSFVFLACKNFFDGVTFHRVLDGFMAQGGDPTGTGGGGPGYEFVNENSDLTFDKDGVVAMANAGPDTNGSQFFITYGAQEFLNGGYTIFGQVVSGMDVVNGITRRDPQQNPSFQGDVIETITITEK